MTIAKAALQLRLLIHTGNETSFEARVLMGQMMRSGVLHL